MNKTLKTLYLFNGLFILASNLLGPLFAIYVSQIDSNVLAVSFTWGAYLFSATLFTFLFSRMPDSKVNKKNFLLYGYVVRFVVWVCYIFVASVPVLIALQVFLGLGEALGTPSYDALLAEHLDKDNHIKDYAIGTVIKNLVSTAGVLTGGFIVNYYGFNYLFVVMALLAAISFLGTAISPKNLYE